MIKVTRRDDGVTNAERGIVLGVTQPQRGDALRRENLPGQEGKYGGKRGFPDELETSKRERIGGSIIHRIDAGHSISHLSKVCPNALLVCDSHRCSEERLCDECKSKPVP